MIVDSESEEEMEPTAMDLEMIDDEKTDEDFDHLTIHQSLQNNDDLERNENLEWLLPSLRKTSKISDAIEKAKSPSKPKNQRKRRRERKLRLQRIKAAKKAKILFS